jgi:hypothetical protein
VPRRAISTVCVCASMKPGNTPVAAPRHARAARMGTFQIHGFANGGNTIALIASAPR